MEEYSVELQAAAAMKRLFFQEVTPGADPLLELIAALIEQEERDTRVGYLITTDQWQAWNELILDQQSELLCEMMRVLKEERLLLPSNPEGMTAWAVSLVLLTLDRMT